MFAHFNSRFAGFAFIIHYSPNERLRTRTRSLGDHLGSIAIRLGSFDARSTFNVSTGVHTKNEETDDRLRADYRSTCVALKGSAKTDFESLAKRRFEPS